ncbi:hypothetical protein NBO_66g0001 [Nosema bombycis CQ1]|uniref:Uncharacterized protein n=1 Tax=Nosema bombycis (strain CQ1 / CVCC 102059) TaxID=578461 RepID=R0KS00_NOSB1|nr:hypothetical protein NBO_66g0001 [Nosema bombycis CQ1]|eukprot:EOB13541.1 hypothetical protein NBO_66g0001 [Nosema bombycis CQ1]
MNFACDHKSKNIEDSIRFFNRHFEKIYINLNYYIKNNIKETYVDSYLARLDKIMKIYSFLFDNIHNLEKNCLIFDLFDHKLIYILENTCARFNADLKFNKEDCTIFLNELFNIINKNKEILPLREKLLKMSLNERNILFNAEFFKCSKYFGEMPELMILGRVCCETSSVNLIIPIHLINLLLRKQKHEENRIFVLFLIKKVFENSSKALLDFFSVQEWFLYCTKDSEHLHQKNLHFILLEINNRKRIEIKFKLKDKCMTKCSIFDLKHIRVVVLLFMLQKMIIFRFINDTKAEFVKYLDLMNSIIDEKDDCSICELYKFIALLKKSNIEET